MPKQVEQGKAFEYACIKALKDQLPTNVEIIENDAFLMANHFYSTISEHLKEKLDKSAKAAMLELLGMEPKLQNSNEEEPLYLTLQEDAAGINADVRDILAIRKPDGWAVGISCKHNHSAVKHSRLSGRLDFGNAWFGIPCSEDYFNEIKPLFDELSLLKSRGALWRDIDNKAVRFYIPLLQAFLCELKKLDSTNPGLIPKRLVSYLIGHHDFYKFIAMDSKKMVVIQAYNFEGTLGQNAGKIKATPKVPVSKLPNEFYSINFKPGSDNTVIVACDNGWGMALRIHNASSRVEPSLKFDVTLTSIPPSLYCHYANWN